MPDAWDRAESATDAWDRAEAIPEEKAPMDRLQEIEDEVRMEQLYGVKPTDSNLPKELIGAATHGFGDAITLGAKNKLLNLIDKAMGGSGRDYELEERYYKNKAPATNLIAGLLGSLITPGGKEVSGAMKGAKTADQITKSAKIIAKAAGITTDAALAAIYGFNRSKEGEGLKDASTDAALSVGLSAGAEGLQTLGSKLKLGPKMMNFIFGLPEDVQNKIKANPDIIKNAKSPQKLVDQLMRSYETVGSKAKELSDIATSKLSTDLKDYIPPEKLSSIISGTQEGLGNTSGMKLKESAFNRLEDLKKQFPENKLFVPREIKPILDDLREEAFEKTTEGPTKKSLLKVQRDIDKILKENTEYRDLMAPSAELTRLSESLKKRIGTKEMQNLETGVKELIPTDKTYSLFKKPDQTESTQKLFKFLDKKLGSNLAEETEKARLADFLSKPQNQASRLVITGTALGAPFGPYGMGAGAAAGKYLDKFGRSTGADILAAGTKASDYLRENKLFKEMLSKDSNLNRKYAASHFIRSQVDPEYNKENSK